MICDYFEMYTCVIQDKIPSFYWNNNQASLYNFIIYYKVITNDGNKQLQQQEQNVFMRK